MNRCNLSLLVLAMTSLSACQKGPSYVQVTLRSDVMITATSFELTATNAGASSTARVERTVSLAPDWTFSYRFGDSRSGDATIDVRAFSGMTEIAHASGTTSLVPHDTAQLVLTMNLDAPTTMLDMATPDQATPDLGAADGGADLRQPVFALSPAMSFPAGHGPVGLVAGDFNEDGKQDVAVADGNLSFVAPGTVSVLFGQGNGKLGSPISYTVGADTNAIVSGDLNGDGKSDIATANRTSRSISVLLAKGDGTFLPAMSYPAGSQPESLAIGFVNNDGAPDIATVDGSTCDVNVLLGDQGGTLRAAKTTAFGQGGVCLSIALGDLNGDMRTDAVVGYWNVNGVNGGTTGAGVMLGNGDGTFGKATIVATGGPGWTATLADINGDRRLDILAANANGTIGVLSGNGDGTFQPPRIVLAGCSATAVVAGDINGDGEVDMVATDSNAKSTTIAVLVNQRDGSFAPRLFMVGDQPYGAAIADLDGDRQPDIVTADWASDTASVLLNQSR